MSRIGKLPVEIPEGVSVSLLENNVSVAGSLGKLERGFSNLVNITLVDKQILVTAKDKEDKKSRQQWGLVRSLVFNMVHGVSKGFTIDLEVFGVGYKSSVKDRILTMYLGHSHDIKILIPKDITVKCPTPTSIQIFGVDKELIGQLAAKIRSLRKPEPYKGKGVKYKGEKILRKEGKKK